MESINTRATGKLNTRMNEILDGYPSRTTYARKRVAALRTCSTYTPSPRPARRTIRLAPPMARKASPIWLYRALGAGLGILTVSVVSGGFEGGAFRQTMGIAAIVAALSITGYYSLRALANAWVAALVATLAPLPILAPYLRYYLSLDGGARYPEVLAAVMITSALIACLWRCVDQRPLSVTE